MKLRTLVAVVVVVAISAACLATCRGDDPAPDDSRATEESAAARLPEERVPRRRVGRSPTGGDPVGGTSGTSETADSAPSGEPEDGEGGVPMGHARVRLTKDGEPLEGAQVFFLPEEAFDEPTPWDGTARSDDAYLEIPLYVPLWQHFDPSLIRRSGQRFVWMKRGATGSDGRLTVPVPADRTLQPYVMAESVGVIAVEPQAAIVVAAGGELDVAIAVAQVRKVTGRCFDAAGKPLHGIAVQAISPLAERPVSRLVQTKADGAFELAVVGDDSEVRVRAAVSYPAHAFGFYRTEADVAPIPALTTVVGVVPGAGPVDVRMADAPLVFIKLTVAKGEPPLSHLQIEGLAFDPRSSAWGRLGGPQYRRGRGRGRERRSVIALPKSEAVRPLMLWSWGRTITSVDPRGRDRVSVEIPRGRRASVRGKGWRETDRVRVVAFLGPEGEELPCIWTEVPLGRTDSWARDDSPVSAIELQIVRDGVVVGRSARVPAGTGPATEVSIDLE